MPTKAPTEVTLPHNFQPRSYQIPLLRARDQGCKRLFHVWHRRAGKEKTDTAAVTAREMFRKVGTYWYVFPTFVQGRKVLWDGMDKDGFRLLDHFPLSLFPYRNDTEMKLRARNGSMLQVVGSDNFNSLMGANPVGVVMSEYALQDPFCWAFIRPILDENGGWVVFNTTPRGENHAYDMWELACANPFHPTKNPLGWFTDLKTADDTRAIPPDVLEQARLECIRLYGNDAVYQQEYFCSWAASLPGAYYAEHVARAYRDGRIGKVPHNEAYAVDTWWDLGINDRMAVWFTQSVGARLRVIDYMEGSGQGLPHYIAALKEKPYVYGRHTAPHDIRHRELTNGKQRLDTAAELGIQFDVAPNVDRMDGIDAVRSIFGSCEFDQEKCKAGINALKSYRKEWDEKRKTFRNTPYHDWSSNGADAFRYMAVSIAPDHQSAVAAQKRKAGSGRYQRKDEGGGWAPVQVLG